MESIQHSIENDLLNFVSYPINCMNSSNQSSAMLISISRLNLIKSENIKWFEDFERNTCRLLMQVGVGFELVYTKFNSSNY